MGRPNRAKDKDGDPLRTQNAKRLDCQKSISDRKKANLDRLKVSMQRAKALGGEVGFSAYFLFEFACGYALFEAHGVNELHLSNYHHPLSLHFKSYEEYINRPHQTFTLKAFHPFSSTAEALVQMNAISNSYFMSQSDF
uniref:Nucleolar protein 58/56 N-terminal domain-containing protein n=1 Tax=Daucus carota subsp. sativus TaxID=79200 RepID=A0A166GBI1_DAUCS